MLQLWAHLLVDSWQIVLKTRELCSGANSMVKGGIREGSRMEDGECCYADGAVLET